MSRTITPASVRKSIQVAVKPERAFEVFTARMGRWWRPDHSLIATPRENVIIEPRPGGRWFERGHDGSECNWGHVIAWEPPHRVLLAWQIDGTWHFNPDLVTEVEIRFIPEGADATRVELEHRYLERFVAHAQAVRHALDSSDGWGGALGPYAALANRG